MYTPRLNHSKRVLERMVFHYFSIFFFFVFKFHPRSQPSDTTTKRLLNVLALAFIVFGTFSFHYCYFIENFIFRFIRFISLRIIIIIIIIHQFLFLCLLSPVGFEICINTFI